MTHTGTHKATYSWALVKFHSTWCTELGFVYREAGSHGVWSMGYGVRELGVNKSPLFKLVNDLE